MADEPIEVTQDSQRISTENSREMTRRADAIDWPALEAITHRDPGGRGLASYRIAGHLLDRGQLRAAAGSLAEHGRSVAIVTGFCARVGDEVTAETDGPPGALFLARAMAALSAEVVLISDRYALPLLEAGRNAWHLDNVAIAEYPFDPQAAAWTEDFLSSDRGRRLTHLIATERPAPSHTVESLAAQRRAGAAPAERFAREVPPDSRDRCHNMRGEPIDRWTAPAHLLFEAVSRRRPEVVSIGIGDGGNELGMGRYPWEVLVESIGSQQAGRIAARVATQYALVAGVSDWAAYALALATVRLRGAEPLGQDWTADSQRELIETIVTQTRAVDGITRRREATVDALPLDVYLQPLVEMRRLLGYDLR